MLKSMCSVECVKTLLVNLKVLGKIGPGSKINTKEKYLELDDTTWYQSALRWYRGDSRYTTSDKIQTTIKKSSIIVNNAIKDLHENGDYLSEKYINSTPEDFLTLVLGILKNAKIGVENLKDTYVHDTTLSSQLEMDISSLDRQIKTIEKNLIN